MNDLESRIRDAFRGHEGSAPTFDLSNARHVAGRTRRRQILNAAGAGIGALAVVVALTTGLGGLLRADRVPADQQPLPEGTVGIELPIEYPAGEELPDLGNTPGPMAAVWMAPQVGGGAPVAVGLAETGEFGTLPIDLPDEDADPQAPPSLTVALSTDGRRIAYLSPAIELVVHDLVSGEDVTPLSEFKTRGYAWVDATHLLGLVAGGSDVDGWVWEPGAAPKRVNPYHVTYGATDLSVAMGGSGPQPWPGHDSCVSPILLDGDGEHGDEHALGWAPSFEVSVLCDFLGVIGPETLLGHWNSDRLPGDWDDPDDGNGTVVALDIHGADSPFEDPALRRVVATAGAPERVTFATDLIGEALGAEGGAS